MVWLVNEGLVFVIMLALFVFALEVGFRLGLRQKNSGKVSKDASKSHIDKIQGAILTLTTLLIGFTFAMSVSRYETRRILVAKEAEAISTTYLRADFLPKAKQDKVKNLLNHYLQARIEFSNIGVSKQAILENYNKTNKIIEEMWKNLKGVESSVLSGLFVNSLNQMIDLQEERQVALENHIPEAVIYVLILISSIGIGFIAYGYGILGNRFHFSAGIFALALIMVFVMILDIDRPKRGFIKVSNESLLRAKAEMNN
jgi:predicted DNA-binding protein YlxM (UPF0122 family)